MIDLKMYKKDLKKNDTDFVIIRGFYQNKRVYYISTKQAFDDFPKTHLFPYDKMCYNYALAQKLLKEKQNIKMGIPLNIF